MSANADLHRKIGAVAEQLVRTQRELGALLARASNPVVESVDAPRRQSLERQRDALLARWSRLVLYWVMEGGTVTLEEAEAQPASA